MSGSTVQYLQPGNPVQCVLCPRSCRIPDGEWGACGVRGNQAAAGVIPYYGRITALGIDPIEKKPLYHYRPGSAILSVGFAGCNLHCPFCQNWSISQNPVAPAQYYSPEDLLRRVQGAGLTQIAYTYSEPLVHIEFLLNSMRLMQQAGIANVLVSNGCVNPDAAEAVLALTDAANIDLKSGSEETYTRVLGGDLTAVRRFIATAWEMKVHLELTTLVVPGLNDDDREIRRCISFIREVSPSIPWHLSAYHPEYLWKAPPTEPAALIALADEARKTLAAVYTGNIAGGRTDTPCAVCGNPLVRRRACGKNRIDTAGLILTEGTYRCASCGAPATFKG